MKLVFYCPLCKSNGRYELVAERAAVKTNGKIKCYLRCQRCNRVAPYFVSEMVYEEILAQQQIELGILR